MIKLVHQLIIWIFSIIALLYIVFYEFILPSPIDNIDTADKIFIILSKIAYSIVAAFIFYIISQYIPVQIPRRQKKIKILAYVYNKASIINVLVFNLKRKLKYSFDIENENNIDYLVGLLKKIKPDGRIEEFENWHQYFLHFKTQMLEEIRSMFFYNEYLNKELLFELINIETLLSFPSSTFAGYKKPNLPDMTYAKDDLYVLFKYTNNLLEFSRKEFTCFFE